MPGIEGRRRSEQSLDNKKVGVEFARGVFLQGISELAEVAAEKDSNSVFAQQVVDRLGVVESAYEDSPENPRSNEAFTTVLESSSYILPAAVEELGLETVVEKLGKDQVLAMIEEGQRLEAELKATAENPDVPLENPESRLYSIKKDIEENY